jgi:hypothetical protein
MSDPEQAVQPAAIEAHDDLVVHRDDGHGRSPGSRDQLIARSRILGDVLRRERDAFGRKKLFRRVAGLSGGGPVDRDRPIRHASTPREQAAEEALAELEALRHGGPRSTAVRVRRSPRSQVLFRLEEVDGRSERVGDLASVVLGPLADPEHHTRGLGTRAVGRRRERHGSGAVVATRHDLHSLIDHRRDPERIHRATGVSPIATRGFPSPIRSAHRPS